MARVAKVANVAPTKVLLDTEKEKVGQDGVVTLSSSGIAELDKPDIQIVDPVRGGDKAELLAFMNEPVEIFVQPPQKPEDPVIFPLWNDGVRQNVIRGQKQTIKRKYVEVLARAKPQSYGNQEYVNADGDKAFRYPTSTSLLYPFQVIKDTDRGAAWLQAILAEAA